MNREEVSRRGLTWWLANNQTPEGYQSSKLLRKIGNEFILIDLTLVLMTWGLSAITKGYHEDIVVAAWFHFMLSLVAWALGSTFLCVVGLVIEWGVYRWETRTTSDPKALDDERLALHLLRSRREDRRKILRELCQSDPIRWSAVKAQLHHLELTSR
jgi:hypothetical protein